MGETDQDNGDPASSLSRPVSHRRLLSNLDKNLDSASDKEATSDDELDLLKDSHDGGEAGRILGVSISRAQTHMKSPSTPAFEKARALKDSRDYFASEPIPDHGNDAENVLQMTESPEQTTKAVSPTSLSAEKRRSSSTRAALGSLQDNSTNRKRSSSGPSASIDSLRKIFSDFRSYSGLGPAAQRDHGLNSDGTGDASRDVSTGGRQARSQSNAGVAHKSIPDPSASLSNLHTSRPKTMRRMTSDNSLYLMRATTGASEFDNTDAFAEVAEMTNSRFKAITDSLADSSLKIPKLPSISFGGSRSLSARPSRTNSDVTRSNTAFNRISNQSLESTNNSDPHLQKPLHYIPPSDKKHPVLTNALSQAVGDIVFLGGYRGSVLRSADFPHHQVWVPVKVGLNLRKVDLEVGLSREDEEKMEEKIIPSGILSHIGPIDIARRLMRKVRKCPNARANQLRVHDYGYDWRLSPHLLSQRLIQFLETLQCNHPDTPPELKGALVVAHSLGGLITRHAVNQRPELFSGVVYAGAPQNCCNILGPLRHGDDVLLSSRVLTAQVNFTLRTSYALLPLDGRCFLDKETGERYDVDFFDANTWDEYRLSPCINPPLPPVTETPPRKSIVDSITDILPSLTPPKKIPWFSASSSNTPPRSPSPPPSVKDKLHAAKDDIESSAKHASETLAAPKHEAQDSLEPSMKGSNSSSGAHKPSVATAVTISKAQAREYLERTLSEVKQFKLELRHIPAHQEANLYPPHAIIYSKSVPTVYGAKVASREAIKCSDAYDDLAFAAGDGVVLASAAQLPHGYRCVKGGRVESDRGHVGLLGDLEGIGRCIAAVVEGRKRGIGLGPGRSR